MFYALQPVVPGMLGECTGNLQARPPRVEKLHYIFLYGYLDDIIQDVGIFLATDAFQDAVNSLNPSGATFTRENLIVETDHYQFDELWPELVTRIKEYSWLKPSGVPGVDDFGITEDCMLVISARVKKAIEKLDLSRCQIELYSS
ncbi:hypothetical protein KF728_16660 [Candidatus Obscuribacterales bacterium]|nr:hypothetical protein [Candidatus Obscuribacterales bacterium]MBX3151790.1 hypothetical protein [Candidatus Obscuribacterales bacterium]